MSLTNSHKIVMVEKHENKVLARADCCINLDRVAARRLICDRLESLTLRHGLSRSFPQETNAEINFCPSRVPGQDS